MANKVNIYHLREAMHNLLNPREQNNFIECLNEFHSKRDVNHFAYKLKLIFDTPAKRKLATMIRQVIPKKDVRLFDQLMANYDSYSLPNRKMELQDFAGPISRAGSSMSVPTSFQRTFVSQNALQRPSNSMSDLLNPEPRSQPSDLQLPVWHSPEVESSSRRIRLDKPEMLAGDIADYGFSIRGGAEHGIGVYVSYVDVKSVAERQGVVPGDMIVAVNGTSFHKISHAEAVKIIKSSPYLELEVRNVGRVPGSFESHQTYTWIDPIGRTVSPPPEVDRIGRYEPNGERKSGLMLLKDADERKVNVMVNGSNPLGLKIRGGNEFGLGIYITGVDPGSPAQNGGLKVGDQILDVNGQSFLDISHKDAVKVLKSSKHLMLTTKDVGKLPYARTTYDHTQWLSSAKMPSKGKHHKKSGKSKRKSEPVFKRGAGSQLMHSSMATQPTTRSFLDGHARNLLNEEERTTINYYLQEYENGHVSVENLVLALMELLNTDAKLSLASELRGVIFPADLETYDYLINEGNPDRGSGRRGSQVSQDSIPSSSSKDSLGDSDLFTPRWEVTNNQRDPLMEAIESIREEPRHMESNRPSLQYEDSQKAFDKDHPVQATVIVADVHRPPSSPSNPRSETWKNPSDDSGVETNGLSNSDNSNRVTVSAQDPVIINEVLGGYAYDDNSSAELEIANDNVLRHMNGNDVIRRHHTRHSPIFKKKVLDASPSREQAPGRSMVETSSRRSSGQDGHQLSSGQDQFDHHRHSNRHDRDLSKKEHSHGVSNATYGQNVSHGKSHNHDRDSSPHQNGGHFENGGHVSSHRGINNQQMAHTEEISYLQDTVLSSGRDRHKKRESINSNISGDSNSRKPVGRPVMVSDGQNHGSQRYEMPWRGDTRRSVNELTPVDINYQPKSKSKHRDNDFIENNLQSRNEPKRVDSKSQWIPTADPREALLNDIRSGKLNLRQVSSSDDGNNSEQYQKRERSRSSGHQGHSRSSRSSSSRERSSGRSHKSEKSPSRGSQYGLPPSGYSDNISRLVSQSHGHHSHNGRSRSRSRSPSTSPSQRSRPEVRTSGHKTQRRKGTTPPSTGSKGSATSRVAFEDLRADGSPHRPSLAKMRGSQNNLPDGAMEIITIYKTKPTLGLAIEGGANTKQPLPRIINIQPGGSAYESGGLKVGHVILEVNGISLENLDHNSCARTIAEAFKNRNVSQMELLVLDPSVT